MAEDRAEILLPDPAEPTEEEVAPGLVMEKEPTTMEDGRYRLYYRFRRERDGEEKE